MNSKDRVISIIKGEIPDRIGSYDSYWEETLDQWKNEGMPAHINPEEFFNHDFRLFGFEQRFGFEEKIIEETDEYSLVFTIEGNIQYVPKDKNQFIKVVDLYGVPKDYIFKGRADWEKYKDIYKAGIERLFSQPKITDKFYHSYKTIKELKDNYRKAKGESKFIAFSVRDPFENARSRFGTEGIFLNLAEDPEFVKKMFYEDAELSLEMLSIMEQEGLEFDGLWCWGDISYNKGMMFSPQMYRELLMPVHKKIFEPFKTKEMPIIYHTDGNLDKALPLLIESGINAIQPIEAKVNDVLQIKKIFGSEITLFGGIDARTMVDKASIEREIKNKLPILKSNGKYIYHSDHSIPPDVNLENYLFTLELVKSYGDY